MKKSLFALILSVGAVCALAALAFGNGKIVDEHRKVSAFSGIKASGAGRIIISKGDSYSCVVTLDSNLQSKYLSKVENGVLVLGFKSGTNVMGPKKLVVRVSMPELKLVKGTGAVEIDISEGFSGPELSIDLNGASKLKGRANYKLMGLSANGASKVGLEGSFSDIAIELGGASSFDLEGRSTGLSARINGASRLNFEDCTLEDADIKANGASQVKLGAVDLSLKADLTGASNLEYSGSPQVQEKTSGGSSIRKRK